MRTTPSQAAVWSVGFVVAALVAVAFAVFITNGFGDVALFVLAFGLMIASYVARRYAREQYLYRNRDDR